MSLFAALGLAFTLERGKVVRIVVDLRKLP